MKPSDKLCNHLNQMLGSEWLHFDEWGMHLTLTPWLKEWFESAEITNEVEFRENEGFMLIESMEYFANADELYPLSLGLTDAPGWAYGGVLNRYANLNNPEDVADLPKVAFAFFERYQVVDWVEELLRDGEVTFETFADLGLEEEAASVETYESCLDS